MSDGNGQMDPTDTASDFNGLDFIMRMHTSKMVTSTIVQIKKVTGGGVGVPATVDVQPLVNQVDGIGTKMAHGIIHGIPVARMQGGTYAVICDPKVGDIGVAVFCHNDISSVKASKKQANPGSLRRHSYEDGIYLGGLLGATPTQYIQFTDNGITMKDKNSNTVTMETGDVTLDSNGTKIVASSSTGRVSITAAGGLWVNNVAVTVP